jgi:phosphoenolpyruvate---glycerone phosphotransferase subunit DhaL
MALLKCAQAFTKLSGSTYGTLLATGLMSAAKATKGRTEVPWSEVSSLLASALQAMAQRSGGKLGEKTVLDALEAVRDCHGRNRRPCRAACGR